MSPKASVPTIEQLKGPPAPPSVDDVAFHARNGIFGQTLQEALNEIVTQDAAAATTATTTNSTRASTPLQLKEHMAENVMKEFGYAVARTKWMDTSSDTTTNNTNPNQRNSKKKKKNKPDKQLPPAALIRGRLDHYNRFNGRWRIMVQKAQIKKRETLEKQRRMRNMPPLWELVETKPSADSIDLQILAYDDL